jgi:N-methylhydantoinase A
VLDRLAERVVADLTEDGAQPEAISLLATARVSYEGQRYQLDVPLTRKEWIPDRLHHGSLGSVAERFRDRHLSLYGYARDEELTLFSLVVVGVATVGAGQAPALTLTASTAGAGQERERAVWFGNGLRPTSILQREELLPGFSFEGAAVVEQADATTVVPAHWSGRVDDHGNLILRANA